MKITGNQVFICLLVMTVAAVASCHKTGLPRTDSAVHISLCELYKNPDAYSGKTITISATITQLPNGKYLYPSSSCDGGFSFIKVDTDHVQNSALTELESSLPASSGRKEFDLEVTGIFDSKYSEQFDSFRYRIIPIDIKPQSPVRIGTPLGAE